MIFIFNFHPRNSYSDYQIPAPPGKYATNLDTDQSIFGGHQRLDSDQIHFTLPANGHKKHQLSLYLPNRTAQVLERITA